MSHSVTRRSFLGTLAAAPLASAAAKGKHVPIGLELYSVRTELQKDVLGTLEAVAKMGYECVEFHAIYYGWTPDYARQVHQRLKDLEIRCYSTHNDIKNYSGDGLEKAIELNKILDAEYLVLASAGTVTSIDGWKRIADTLNSANNTMKSRGLHAGYHNHDTEFRPVNGQKPMDIIAANTDKSIMMQLDVGHCIETGSDPVEFINSHPGRIRSLHLKDWAPQKGFKVLFGEGIVPWQKVCAAAEDKGGVQYYLIEQEGSDLPELEAADRCLVAYRNLRG